MTAVCLLLGSCGNPASVTPTEPSQNEQVCLAFVQNQMLHGGGVQTNYYEKPATAELATGREVLSESQGLMMLYATATLDRLTFDAAYGFVKSRLDNGKIFTYRFNAQAAEIEAFTVNAAVDDLRIIKALYAAGSAFSDKALTQAADGYGKRFYKTNIRDNRLYDFYDSVLDRKNDFITLCYLDLEALGRLAKMDKRYLVVYDTALETLLGGYISDDFPMFMTRLDYKKQQYEAPNGINMVEAVLSAYNLSFAGRCPETTTTFLNKALHDGKIYASYELDGRPRDTYESTAIYALTAMLAQNLGDRQMYDKSIALMNQFMVSDPNSTLYGAFGDKNNVYSFDNLMALLAYRKGAEQ